MRASKRAREGDFRSAVPGLANVYSAAGTVQSRQDAEQRPQRQSRPRNVSVRDAARPTSPEEAPADPRPPPRALSGRQLDALRESTAVVQRWLEGERGGLLDERTVCACVVTSLLRLGREEAAVGTRLVCQAAGPGTRAPAGPDAIRSAATEAAAPLAEVLTSAGGLSGPAGPAASAAALLLARLRQLGTAGASSARGWEGWVRLEAWPDAAAAWVAGGCRWREADGAVGGAGAVRVRAAAAAAMTLGWGRLAEAVRDAVAASSARDRSAGCAGVGGLCSAAAASVAHRITADRLGDGVSGRAVCRAVAEGALAAVWLYGPWSTRDGGAGRGGGAVGGGAASHGAQSRGGQALASAAVAIGEAFWESGAPRAGEPGAGGMGAFALAQAEDAADASAGCSGAAAGAAARVRLRADASAAAGSVVSRWGDATDSAAESLSVELSRLEQALLPPPDERGRDGDEPSDSASAPDDEPPWVGYCPASMARRLRCLLRAAGQAGQRLPVVGGRGAADAAPGKAAGAAGEEEDASGVGAELGQAVLERLLAGWSDEAAAATTLPVVGVGGAVEAAVRAGVAACQEGRADVAIAAGLVCAAAAEGWRLVGLARSSALALAIDAGRSGALAAGETAQRRHHAPPSSGLRLVPLVAAGAPASGSAVLSAGGAARAASLAAVTAAWALMGLPSEQQEAVGDVLSDALAVLGTACAMQCAGAAAPQARTAETAAALQRVLGAAPGRAGLVPQVLLAASSLEPADRLARVLERAVGVQPLSGHGASCLLRAWADAVAGGGPPACSEAAVRHAVLGAMAAADAPAAKAVLAAARKALARRPSASTKPCSPCGSDGGCAASSASSASACRDAVESFAAALAAWRGGRPSASPAWWHPGLREGWGAWAEAASLVDWAAGGAGSAAAAFRAAAAATAVPAGLASLSEALDAASPTVRAASRCGRQPPWWLLAALDASEPAALEAAQLRQAERALRQAERAIQQGGGAAAPGSAAAAPQDAAGTAPGEGAAAEQSASGGAAGGADVCASLLALLGPSCSGRLPAACTAPGGTNASSHPQSVVRAALAAGTAAADLKSRAIRRLAKRDERRAAAIALAAETDADLAAAASALRAAREGAGGERPAKRRVGLSGLAAACDALAELA